MTKKDGRAVLSVERVSAALRDAGLDLAPDELTVEAREDRYLVRLPDERLAWFPINDRGRRCLDSERRVLRLLAERCAFRVPRVTFVSGQGWDVRAIVPGMCDPWGLFERVRSDKALAERIGGGIGSILAEQHTRISQADVRGWLPAQVSWPEPSDCIRRCLPDVIDDTLLLAEIDGVLAGYDAVAVAPDDCVLVHGDLGLHNIAVDPETDGVAGVFDYDEACWADRHHDFRYLVFGHESEPMLDAALAVYEPASGHTLSRARIRLYNAASAIGFLAFRRGVPPDQTSCGRTLAEDLKWVRAALAQL